MGVSLSDLARGFRYHTLLAIDPAGQAAVAGHGGELNSVVAGLARVHGPPWVVMAKVEQAEAMELATLIGRTIGGGIMGLLAHLASLGRTMWLRVQRRCHRALAPVAKRALHLNETSIDGTRVTDAARRILERNAARTDISMPVRDGCTFTSTRRREESAGARTPTIAPTAHALRGEALRARAVGMDGDPTTPVRQRQLTEVLMQWMPPSGEPAPVPPSGREAGGDPSVLDLRVLEELVGAEPEVVEDFLRQYLDSARALMAELRTGHAQGNLAQVGSATHRLKSSSRAVGAVRFGDLCAQIESAAKQMHGADVDASIPPLELGFAAVERAILQHLGTA